MLRVSSISTGILLSVSFLVYFVSADGGYGGYGGGGQLLAARSPLVDELRIKIQGLQINPLWTTDKNLGRLLVETRYNVQRAARRLRRTASFRAKIKADNLLDWAPPVHFTNNLPYECSGYANDGSPVFVFPFGQWNTPNLFREGAKAREFYMYFLRMLEDARSRLAGRKNPQTGEDADQAVFIVDAKGFGLKQLLNIRATWTFMRIAYAIDRHYPFLVQRWYVVNAPLTFQVFWKLIRLAASRTLERAVDISSSYSKRGVNTLAHHIPKDAIPVSLGGTYVAKFAQNAPPTPSLSAVVGSLSKKLSAFSAAIAPPPTQKPLATNKCLTCSPNVPKYGPPGYSISQYGPPSSEAPKHGGYGAPSPSKPKTPDYNAPELAIPNLNGYGFPPKFAGYRASRPTAPKTGGYRASSSHAPRSPVRPTVSTVTTPVALVSSSLPAAPQNQYGPPEVLKPQDVKMVAPWWYSGYG